VNRNRFARIKEIALKAADLSVSERKAYLNDLGKDDPELRKEVEAFLVHEHSFPDILDSGRISEALNTDPFVGRTISHYTIREKLGEGGMGVVYKAEDTILRRTVALKFLPRALTASSEARTRFIHEARAAAALDHPNICTVYEIDDADDRIFISMAYIEGQTLREKIRSDSLTQEEFLDITLQIAEGLKEAHDKGIVHRDIKPSNIMISPNGRVKIMDFGLARSVTQTRITKTGMTMGTTAYLSPEQARGEAVDNRTDIWSLGVILYEMAAGILPFRGDHEQAIIYSILNHEPEPISVLCPTIPVKLQRVVNKALQKSLAERYGNLEEMISDLKELQGIVVPIWTRARRILAAKTSLKKRIQGATAAVSLVVLAVLLSQVLNLGGRKEPVCTGRLVQVTNTDQWEGESVISPDGSRIAFASAASGNYDVFVVDLVSGTLKQVTTHPASDRDPAWFPDGDALAFASDRGGGSAIWKSELRGDMPELLLQDAEYPAISPDGRRIAFARSSESSSQRIGFADLTDSPQVTMLTGNETGMWNHQDPAWSPDGRYVCYSTASDLWTVSLSDGIIRQITTDDQPHRHPTWSSDGQFIYFTSYRDGTPALWWIPAEGGHPKRLTTGTGAETHPSISSDGTSLAYSTSQTRHDIVIMDLDTGVESRLAGLVGGWMPAFSPDGSSIVFVSNRLGSHLDLWLQPLNADSALSQPARLTDHVGVASYPSFSPDGNWISYYRIIDQQRDIWTIPATGGPPLQFTNDAAEDVHPQWSPDGTRIAFVSNRTGMYHIWIVRVENGRRAGSPWRLTTGDMIEFFPAWSPDGKSIAYIAWHAHQSEVWIINVEASAQPRQVTKGASAARVQWNPDTGDLMVSGFWGEGSKSLRLVSPETGEARIPTHPVMFGSEESYADFDVTSDGRFLAYTHEHPGGDIWVFVSEPGAY